ncbi:MAG: AMP-binding protein, partial [Terriglobia bacterium]
AMHDSGGTLCPAPNFSYELCARKIPDDALEGLDLSRWRVAINAGEAVLPDTLARFARRFEPFGFRAESFVPCYGLAESSVALSFTPMNRLPVIDTIRRELFESKGRAVPADAGDANVLQFVANGRPMRGHQVKVLGEDGQELNERIQGRIFFRGPSRTAGYYRNPVATAAVITEDGWMDSGDLGYWAGGELYVTGRLKDCIIKSGRNIIPQEIEAAAAEVLGVRKGCVAAFGALDPQTGTERLVVVAETRAAAPEELRRIEEEIVKRVDAVLGIPPDKVALVEPQSVPKTSSGKIRRNATRALYVNGQLTSRKRAPWVQMGRLWAENLRNWLRLSARNGAARLHHAYRAAAFGAIARAGGLAARLMPGAHASASITRIAARAIVRLGRRRVRIMEALQTECREPVVWVSNRAGHLDPLVAAARLRSRFASADALRDLPPAVRYLLEPLVISPVPGLPADGTLRERILQALNAGFPVLVFADGPVGAPPLRSRFRLEAFHAAAAAMTPLRPVLFRGTEGILWPSGRWEAKLRNSQIGLESAAEAGADIRPTLIVGEAVQPAPAGAQDEAAWRERVREALGRLAG